jgi:hypothetical protein
VRVVVSIVYVFFWYLAAHGTGRIWIHVFWFGSGDAGVAEHCHVVQKVPSRLVVGGKSSVLLRLGWQLVNI